MQRFADKVSPYHIVLFLSSQNGKSAVNTPIDTAAGRLRRQSACTAREKFAALNLAAVLETLLDLPDQFAEKSTR
jgi:hypothetical protein